MDREYSTSKSLMSSIRSAICVPLRSHEGKPIGMVQLDRHGQQRLFQEQDLELLAALALPIGVAIENHRLLQERATWTAARKIQQALLPRSQPRIPGFQFWECYRPLRRWEATFTTTSQSSKPRRNPGSRSPGPSRWAMSRARGCRRP